MSYVQCPSCNSPNRAKDKRCYNCKAFLIAPKPAETEAEEFITEHVSFGKAFLAVMLSVVTGGVLGLLLQLLDPDLPFSLVEAGLGALCATITAFAISTFVETPDWQRFQRIVPATGFGALVGIALFSIWDIFDLPGGYIAIGSLAGFFAGLPIAVSFGLLGGESRPVGKVEYFHLLIGFVVGCMVGLAFFDGDGDYEYLGVGGAFALLPALFGGRVNLWDYFGQALLSEGGDSDDFDY